MERVRERSGQERDAAADPLALVLAQLERPPGRRRTAWAYRLSLALVTVFMVALPLVYVAIVAATGWGVVWYVLHEASFLDRVDSVHAWVLVGVGPPVIGGILFFFLLKPLLARRERYAKAHVLTPEEEPEIHGFVARLGDALDAPRPERIEVDLRVNASASFASGLGSVFGGRLALTIGLPLVSTLSLRELTAILAHEFGHFSQGAGLRFYYLTSAVNRWFARVVFGRDQWDVRLKRWSEKGSWMAMIILNFARGCVWLSRRFLFLLMKLGIRASSMMSRQMELDADRNAVRLCGTDAFVRSMELLPQIDAASRWASELNGRMFTQGRLADDFPALVRLGLERLGEDVRRGIVERSMDTTVDMYASHPPTGIRIRRARDMKLDGVVTTDGPASVLFSDFPELCRGLTSEAFRASMASRFDPKLLVASEEIVRAHDGAERAAARTKEFFLDVHMGPRTLDMHSVPGAPEAPGQAFEGLKRARRAALQNVGAARKASEEARACAERRVAAEAARHLLCVGLPVRDESLAHLTSTADADRLIQELRAEKERCRERIKPLATSQHERIQHIVSLLHLDQVRDRLEEREELLDRGKRALRVFVDLRPAADEINRLLRSLAVFHRVGPQLVGVPGEKWNEVFAPLGKELRSHMVEVCAKLKGVEHPLHVSGEERDLARILFPALPRQEEDLASHLRMASQALQELSALMDHAQSELADVCLRAEAAMNLRALRV